MENVVNDAESLGHKYREYHDKHRQKLQNKFNLIHHYFKQNI